MKLKAIKRWFFGLWCDFEKSWVKAGEAQMRIEEAKLRISHPAYHSQSPKKQNDQFENI